MFFCKLVSFTNFLWRKIDIVNKPLLFFIMQGTEATIFLHQASEDLKTQLFNSSDVMNIE